ncbi:CapA family protein [Leptospira idonii]|uniref:CapA family protein n=1 Tax=Leptospira idonii TaxID=1193500 RepID=A0A4R9LX50_9LEPT|nr:CapA family protein [Leptospira idonii]TGN17589.1 CapA family protein [Leptospira idonii]
MKNPLIFPQKPLSSSFRFVFLILIVSLVLNCVGEKNKTILKKQQTDSHLTSIANEDQVLTIKAVGDTIPGSNYPESHLIDDEAKLFSPMQEHLSGADILFGNFESTLTDYPKSGKDIKRPNTYAFRTPPHYAKLMKDVGFNVLSVVNNHSMDFTEQGFNDTIKNINDAGMLAVGGKGLIQYTTVKNLKIAFIGFSYQRYHNSITNFEASEALVNEAVQNADLVVLSIHAGAEANAIHTPDQEEIFLGENRGNMVKFSHRMIDLGADLVLGHGPHVPRGMEIYKDRLIAYSLGNFLGYRTLSVKGDNGLSLVLQVALDKQGNFLKGNIIPVIMEVPGIPYPDPQLRSVKLIQSLTRSDFPGSPIEIDEKGNIRRSVGTISWNEL